MNKSRVEKGSIKNFCLHKYEEATDTLIYAAMVKIWKNTYEIQK